MLFIIHTLFQSLLSDVNSHSFAVRKVTLQRPFNQSTLQCNTHYQLIIKPISFYITNDWIKLRLFVTDGHRQKSTVLCGSYFSIFSWSYDLLHCFVSKYYIFIRRSIAEYVKNKAINYSHSWHFIVNSQSIALCHSQLSHDLGSVCILEWLSRCFSWVVLSN